MPNKTGLRLGRKTSIKVLPPSMQKIGFSFYQIVFLTKQTTTALLRDCSNLPMSYTSILSVLFKTTVAFNFT